MRSPTASAAWAGTTRSRRSRDPTACTASFDEAPTGVRVNLVTGSASGHGKDRLAGIENVDGSDHSDAITGNAGKNAIDGSKGNDRIAGGPGADRLDGQAGRDRVDGGTGRDKCLGAERKQRCP
jgi:Ca2+-binding RTX toxin-like protein